MPQITKPAVVMTLKKRGGSVYVRVDARMRGVQLPDHLLGKEAVILQVCAPNAHVPITDFQLTSHCLTCTLSFSRQPFFCVLPWDAIDATTRRYGRSDGCVIRGAGGGVSGAFGHSIPLFCSSKTRTSRRSPAPSLGSARAPCARDASRGRVV